MPHEYTNLAGMPTKQPHNESDLLETGQSGRGWSYWSTYDLCPRKFFIQYRLGLVAPSGKGAALGVLVHEMLAHKYMRQMGMKGLPDFAALVRAVIAKHDIEDKAVDVARRIFADYNLRFATDALEPISVEQKYEVAFVRRTDGGVDVACLDPSRVPAQGQAIEVGHHVPFSARIDLVAKDKTNGKVYIIDHKTSYRVGKAMFDMYGASGQMHGLWWLGRAFWGIPPFSGVLLNALETWTGDTIVRRPATWAPKFATAFPAKVCTIADDVARADRTWGMNEDAWPARMHVQICTGKYPCEWYGRCTQGVGR